MNGIGLTVLVGCIAAMGATLAHAEPQATHPAQTNIISLLAARDAAVLSGDVAGFAKTQVKGAIGSPPEECATREKQKTELISLHK